MGGLGVARVAGVAARNGVDLQGLEGEDGAAGHERASDVLFQRADPVVDYTERIEELQRFGGIRRDEHRGGLDVRHVLCRDHGCAEKRSGDVRMRTDRVLTGSLMSLEPGDLGRDLLEVLNDFFGQQLVIRRRDVERLAGGRRVRELLLFGRVVGREGREILGLIFVVHSSDIIEEIARHPKAVTDRFCEILLYAKAVSDRFRALSNSIKAVGNRFQEFSDIPKADIDRFQELPEHAKAVANGF